MTAKLQPDIEAVSSDYYDIEELVTERLHEIHKIYGLDSLRDIADRLKHPSTSMSKSPWGAARAENILHHPDDIGMRDRDRPGAVLRQDMLDAGARRGGREPAVREAPA